MKTVSLKASDRCLIISDVHIGSLFGGARIQKLMKLISKYDYVVFNGDIIELLVYNFYKLIEGKAAPLFFWMFENQKKFTYIVGNHDDELWDISEDLFFPIYQEVRLMQGRNEFIITHGHQFDRLNRVTTWKSRILFFLEWAANMIFHTNWQDLIFRRKKFFFNFADKIRAKELPVLRERARLYAQSIGAKTLIHGHTHFKNDETVRGTRIIDGGGFVIGCSYVEIYKGQAVIGVCDEN